MSPAELRRLLERNGSYAVIAAAASSGELAALLPATLFAHIGDVYRRVEAAAGDEVDGVDALRLTALLHEEPPARLPDLVAGAGCADLGPTVVAVVGGFGALWKLSTEWEVAAYVAAHRVHLVPLLLFELAHEGRVTPQMQWAAALGGLDVAFGHWAARLAAE